MDDITARLCELHQKNLLEGNGEIAELYDLVCKISSRLRVAEVQLARMREQVTRNHVLFDDEVNGRNLDQVKYIPELGISVIIPSK